MNTVEIKRYRTKPGSRLPQADAELIGLELERLTGEEGVTAPQVVEASRPEDAALHHFFEWDDPTAAELYREEQARHLLNCVEVVVVPREGEPEESVRAFHMVSIEAEGKAERRYYPLEVVTQNEDMAEKVIRQARGELRAFRRKYSVYQKYIRKDAALSKAFDAIHELDN